MSRRLLANAFSINMFTAAEAAVNFERIEAGDVPADVVSFVGHADTAAVVAGILGFPVAVSRASLALEAGDVLFVAQFSGPRLPEGATELPAGAKIQFWRVTVA